MKVVLAATDGSDAGTAALNQAADIADAHGAQLIVLTVMPRNPEPGPMNEEIKQYARAEHFAGEAEARALFAENIIAEAKAIVASRHDLETIYISRAGDPAEEILACARKHSADEIVLGSRGRGPLEAFWFGSVSQRVANSATCSVTIVPSSK